MNTVKFESEVCHGVIRVPEEYHDLETRHVKVIVIIDDESIRPTKGDNLDAFRRMQISAANQPIAVPDDIDIVSLPETAADDIF
jgi:hypothetical protein